MGIGSVFGESLPLKVQYIQNEITIDDEVYNGIRKVNADNNNNNFMTRSNIEEAIKSLKIKNTEGFDRIPQRIML